MAINREVREILQAATPTQVQWFIARLTAKSDTVACKRVGLSRSALRRWDNLAELRHALNLSMLDGATAALAVLEAAAVEAAHVLVKELTSAKEPRAAAEAILNRVGVPAMSRMSRMGEEDDDGAGVRISLEGLSAVQIRTLAGTDTPEARRADDLLAALPLDRMIGGQYEEVHVDETGAPVDNNGGGGGPS